MLRCSWTVVGMEVGSNAIITNMPAKEMNGTYTQLSRVSQIPSHQLL